MIKSYLDYSREELIEELNRIAPIFIKREVVILDLMAQGFGGKEIAGKVKSTSRGISSAWDRMRKKIDAKTNVEMVVWAIKNKIIEI